MDKVSSEFADRTPDRKEVRQQSDLRVPLNARVRYHLLILNLRRQRSAVGATKETLASQLKTDDLGWVFNERFYDSLYDELNKK